jgi:hypothetical protein
MARTVEPRCIPLPRAAIARACLLPALLAWVALSIGCRSFPKAASTETLFQGQDSYAGLGLVQPSNNRDWLPDVAVLPFAEIEKNQAVVHNIRNCTYRADNEYVIKHYDRTFDLNKIRTVDFIVAPFKEAQGLAHTMMSFGFENDEHICVSVEARLEKGEKYAPVLGAMKQFELIYVLADERDVIVRRTRFRDVDVYLYRTVATPEQSREIFVDVLERVNKLYREPEFYDSLTNNCTTNLVNHVNQIRPNRVPLWDLRVLLPGYADQLAYELGLLDKSKPFEQLRSEAHINSQANQVATRDDFSKLIRR